MLVKWVRYCMKLLDVRLRDIKVVQKLPIQWPYYKVFQAHLISYKNVLQLLFLCNTACNPRKAYLTYWTDILLNTGSNQDPQFDQNKTIRQQLNKKILYCHYFDATFFAWCILSSCLLSWTSAKQYHSHFHLEVSYCKKFLKTSLYIFNFYTEFKKMKY